MNRIQIKETANRLRFACLKTAAPIPPITESYPDASVDDAYSIQMENVRRCVSEGEIISGKKIGLTSEGIQKQLGVNEPDYGHLFQSMDYSDSRRLPFDAFILPKIEGEIAFCLKEDLTGGSITMDDVIWATDYIVPAFEIVDSRVADWRIKLVDTVADNASSGAYVLGTKRTSLQGIDLSKVKMLLYKDELLLTEGLGSAVLGNPIASVAWLANRLNHYGVALKAGEIVLSGAFTAAPAAEKGDSFHADFGPLGSVTAVFV